MVNVVWGPAGVDLALGAGAPTPYPAASSTSSSTSPSPYATAPPPQWSNFANLAKQAREQLEVGLGEVVKAGEGLIERVEDVIVEAGECRVTADASVFWTTSTLAVLGHSLASLIELI